MSTQFPKILAIIPCYNEEAAIGDLLKEFSLIDFPCDTLVIDDGSHDSSHSIAEQFSRTIRFEKNKGVAEVIRAGLRYAIEHNYDYCIQIDGDGQHKPSEIGKFLPYLASSPSILVGSRYRGLSGKWSLRRVAAMMISMQLYIIFRKWISDPFSGMRMMDRQAMQFFAGRDGFLDAETITFSLREGFAIVEVPISMRARVGGISHVGGLKGVKFMLNLMCRNMHYAHKKGS